MALAISDERDAVERIARFRLLPEPAVLVTVGMAYEGMDAPEVTHLACLTHVRSVPWLEQMVARATRFDAHGGDYEGQTAVVYHPDDPLFRLFRRAVEADQSGRARAPRDERQEELPLLPDAEHEPPVRSLLVPLRSAATDLRFEMVRPRPRPEPGAGPDPWQARWSRRRARRSSGCGGASGRWWRRRWSRTRPRAWSGGPGATTPTTRC